MNAWLGAWEGKYQDRDEVWLRFFDANGLVLPTAAEAAKQLADTERRRLEQAEAELARLKSQLAERQAQQKPQ